MRVIALIGLIILIGESCAKPVDPPRDDEIKKIIDDWFYGKDNFSNYLSKSNEVSGPWIVKETKVLSTERIPGTRKSFKIIAFSKGGYTTFEQPQLFYDTIRLEIKKESYGWSKKKMEHDFKYIPFREATLSHF